MQVAMLVEPLEPNGRVLVQFTGAAALHPQVHTLPGAPTGVAPPQLEVMYSWSAFRLQRAVPKHPQLLVLVMFQSAWKSVGVVPPGTETTNASEQNEKKSAPIGLAAELNAP